MLDQAVSNTCERHQKKQPQGGLTRTKSLTVPGALVFCFRPLLSSSFPKPLSGGSHWTLVSESSSVYYTAGPHTLAEPTPASSAPAAPPSPQQMCPPRPRISSFRTGFRSKKKKRLLFVLDSTYHGYFHTGQKKKIVQGGISAHLWWSHILKNQENFGGKSKTQCEYFDLSLSKSNSDYSLKFVFVFTSH